MNDFFAGVLKSVVWFVKIFLILPALAVFAYSLVKVVLIGKADIVPFLSSFINYSILPVMDFYVRAGQFLCELPGLLVK